MADVALLCPQRRDRDAVASLTGRRGEVAFVGDDLESAPSVDIDALVSECAAHEPRAVVATKDRSALLAAIVNARLGLGGPSPAAVISCQHKLRSRQIQQRVVPDATPAFMPVDDPEALAYPCFVKPVVGRLSDSAVLAREPADVARLEPGRAYALAYERLALQAGLEPALAPGSCAGFMAEEVLEGDEVTLEGFVHEGEVEVLGITDSLNYPGTSSFERFDYPSALSDSRLAEFAGVARTVMPAIGFDGGLFNVEFFVPASGPAMIVEINARMASQFAPLLEHVHGLSSYELLLSLACGERPRWPPAGAARFALSYCLRVFEDAYVAAVPAAADDVELLVEPGELLSRQGTNDVDSYRLCLFAQLGSERAATLSAAHRRARELLEQFELRPAESGGA
jgi:biotin carboxylase